jgi:WhiB family transcriptional regulator, redox-sensing transcriptional regulator
VNLQCKDPAEEIEALGLVEALMLSTGPMPSLRELLGRPTWQANAACRGGGVDSFFPVGGTSLLRARRICNGCEVSEECLRYALERPSLKGIWAGTSERRRRRLRLQGRGIDTLAGGHELPAVKEVV